MEGLASVKVVSWNILAHVYICKNPPSHFQGKAATLRRRREMTISSLQLLDPDVFCLQEVDHYNQYWQGAWDEMGFDSFWDQRQKKKEGAAMGWKKSCVECLDKIRVDLNNVDSCPEYEDAALNANIHRNNVGQIALFQTRAEPGRRFIVVNVHVFWNPVATDVKLFQVHYLCSQVQHYRLQWQRQYEDAVAVPVIWAGDFNSLPSGMIVRMMSNQEPPIQHPEYVRFVERKHPKIHAKKNDGLRMSIPLRNCVERPKYFTNYTEDFKGVIDYIWISCDHHADGDMEVCQASIYSPDAHQYIISDEEDADKSLKPEYVVGPKTREKPRSKYATLPSKSWASDHLPVVVKFRFRRP